MKTPVLILAFLVINSLYSGTVLATTNDPYYEVESVKVTELTAEEALEFNNDQPKPYNLAAKINEIKKLTAATTRPNPVEAASPGAKANGIIMIIDKLIAIGERLMPAIKAGKPVVNNNPMAAVSVLPRTNEKDFVVHGMGGWSIPVSKHYKIVFSNMLGMDVISFVYSITYQYNGSLNGKGKYLTGIRASARNIDVAFGFDLNASSRLLAISNIGTSQDVIAGATLEISYTVGNMLRTITRNDGFFIAGNGKLWKMD